MQPQILEIKYLDCKLFRLQKELDEARTGFWDQGGDVKKVARYLRKQREISRTITRISKLGLK